MKDNKEKSPKINHLLLYTFNTTFFEVVEARLVLSTTVILLSFPEMRLV